MPEIAGRLRAAWSAGRAGGAGALIRGTIAQGLHELAVYTGDAKATATWGERSGCVKGEEKEELNLSVSFVYIIPSPFLSSLLCQERLIAFSKLIAHRNSRAIFHRNLPVNGRARPCAGTNVKIVHGKDNIMNPF
jgi:hypothetical protein